MDDPACDSQVGPVRWDQAGIGAFAGHQPRIGDGEVHRTCGVEQLRERHTRGEHVVDAVGAPGAVRAQVDERRLEALRLECTAQSPDGACHVFVVSPVGIERDDNLEAVIEPGKGLDQLALVDRHVDTGDRHREDPMEPFAPGSRQDRVSLDHAFGDDHGAHMIEPVCLRLSHGRVGVRSNPRLKLLGVSDLPFDQPELLFCASKRLPHVGGVERVDDAGVHVCGKFAHAGAAFGPEGELELDHGPVVV